MLFAMKFIEQEQQICTNLKMAAHGAPPEAISNKNPIYQISHLWR